MDQSRGDIESLAKVIEDAVAEARPKKQADFLVVELVHVPVHVPLI